MDGYVAYKPRKIRGHRSTGILLEELSLVAARWTILTSSSEQLLLLRGKRDLARGELADASDGGDKRRDEGLMAGWDGEKRKK